MNLFPLHMVMSASLIVALIMVAILIIAPPIYLVLHKRNVPEHPVPILLKILLLIPSLTWVGIFTGSYLAFRKKKITNNESQYKFSSNSRFYGIFLLLMSIVCTIIYYTSKNNPF